ncbi:hypothetical protein ACIBJC_08950 [Streptomyces sp. NPDC050509]|uniref:hypothetical protein n=1 Tax=Streptomyces sp. NPDC050509 TaxID=3365620 RepID=UPI0037B5E21D
MRQARIRWTRSTSSGAGSTKSLPYVSSPSLYALVRPRDLTRNEIRDEISGGRLVMLSVHRTIRTPAAAPPQRGGHLVLAVGAGPTGVALHNPSGLPGQSQQFTHVPWTGLDRFFAGRGIILGDSEHAAPLS